jgi:hypothetical protein
MKTIAIKEVFRSVQAATILPTNYRQQATLDLSKSKNVIIGAIVFGIVLLIAVGWLLVQFTHLLRPIALEGIRFREILTITPDGQPSIVLPIVDAVVAFVLVMFIHELVHGVFFWWFSGQRPTFGVKGLFVYAAARPEVYLPRNQYIVVGTAPLVLLTLVGLLLMVIVPVVAVSILSLFIAFNAAGAAGDLVMAVRLLSYSPNTLIQDSDTGVIVYRPEKNQRAA